MIVSKNDILQELSKQATTQPNATRKKALINLMRIVSQSNCNVYKSQSSINGSNIGFIVESLVIYEMQGSATDNNCCGCDMVLNGKNYEIKSFVKAPSHALSKPCAVFFLDAHCKKLALYYITKEESKKLLGKRFDQNILQYKHKLIRAYN